jgi:glycosyltransferase involved in cell wall biosynthesis
LGIGAEEFVLIQVARMDYLKDHATAVRTFGRVLERQPQARLLLVGEGPERDKTQALVRERGLGNRVQFLGLRKDISRLLRAADVFLLTSVSEGIPVTVIEAMAAGLPVVATRVGGMAEVVEHHRTGLLAEARDDAGLAAAILQLTEDCAVGRRMGELGRARVEKMFTENHMHEQYLEIYQQVLRG